MDTPDMRRPEPTVTQDPASNTNSHKKYTKSDSLIKVKLALGNDPRQPGEIENRVMSLAELDSLFSGYRIGDKMGQYFCGPMASLHRCKANVLPWQLFCLDFDGADGVSPDPAVLRTFFRDITHWGYSTYSHSPEKGKFRVVLLLNRQVNSDEYRRLFDALTESLPFVPDPKLNHMDQAVFLPARPANSPEPVFWRENGQPFNVDSALKQAAERQHAESRAESSYRPPADSMSVIAKFNAAHDIRTILEINNYQRRGKRYLHPRSESGIPSVSILADGKLCFSHSSNDQLGDGQPHDAFDTWAILAHGGDKKQATKAAAKLLGIGKAFSFADPDANLDFPSEADRPCYRVYWDWCGPVKDGKRSRRPGVYYHGFTEAKGNQPAVNLDLPVCSPLIVKALTCTDDHHQLFGYQLEFRDLHGKTRQWALPRNLLRGSCEELRGELLDHGVEIYDRARLPMYLQDKVPRNRILSATRTGWADSGKAFVLPNRVIGSDRVIFQSETATTDQAATTGGNLAAWQSEVATLAVGNPVMALSICVALAGPLLEKVHRQSSGIHWHDDSSTGKTTACMVGASVWGDKSFIRTWRATSNGLEGAAAALNDTLLCLDEINEADPRQVGEIIYAIANGVGKTRANRIGTARKVHRWQLAILSTGERTLKAQMAEGGKQMKVGQEVRLLNVPSARRFGAFDDLHQFPDGRALADHLKAATNRHFGHAGPAFVEALLKDCRDFGGELDIIIKAEAFKPEDSQSGRAAASFALFGLAGELATEWGILPWPEGTALIAAAECHQAWLKARGTGITEHRQILEAVTDFIAKHADGRFSLKGVDPSHGPVIHNRAGWWAETADGERVYLFNAPGLREATAGHDFARALAALDQAGWIVDRDSGRHTKKTYIEPGLKPSLYWVQVRDGA